MAKKFADLRAQMPPESQARSEAKAQAMLAEMPLNELRQARGLSQKMLAEVLHVLVVAAQHAEGVQGVGPAQGQAQDAHVVADLVHRLEHHGLLGHTLLDRRQFAGVDLLGQHRRLGELSRPRRVA